jgi:mRNA interferase HicA
VAGRAGQVALRVDLVDFVSCRSAFFKLPGELAQINKIVYPLAVKSSEFKRWLAAKGATFSTAKGSHLRVELNGRISILPMHSKDLKKGTVEGVKKQLGLK